VRVLPFLGARTAHDFHFWAAISPASSTKTEEKKMDEQMLNIEPFTAMANFNPNDEGDADLREVKVVGMIDGDNRPRWVCVETIQGWEFPKFAEAVKRIAPPQ
jgi:hypothetical protein